METENIEDYMYAVTTYKCRFCNFNCSSVQGMSEHVKAAHIKPPSQDLTASVMAEKKKADNPTNQFAVETAVQTQTSEMPADALQNTESSQSKTINKVQVIPEESANSAISAVLSNLVNMAKDTIVTKDAINTSSTSTPSTLLVNSSEGTHAARTENMTLNIDGKIVEITLENDTNMSNSQVPLVFKQDEQAPPSGELMIADDTNYQISDNGSQPVTKELFLCGQCSMGFNSINECKVHMMCDHEVPADNLVSTEECGKVSVGTQMEAKKKRGRKRKDEVKEEEKPVELDDSDVEWTMESEYISRGSRSRRKIQPPKALQENYYLGKTKSKKEKPKLLKKYNKKCPVSGCHAKFCTEEGLIFHQKCHGEDPRVFHCPECQEEFPRWNPLRMHLWKIHKVDTDLLTCEICNNYKTYLVCKLLIHKEVHGQDRPYTCDTCGKCFKQFSQMKNHQIIHAEVKAGSPQDKWYHEKTCDICNRTFANQKCLNNHVKAVHGKVKPFLCTYCGYASARKAMLTLHLRTHTGDKPFACEFCSFTTGDHNSLRRHKMRHTGQKLYKCQYCGYSCIQAISIKMHMKNKHSEGMGVYCCDICTFRTVNEKNYKNHMEDHRNGLIPETPAQPPPRPQYQVITQTSFPTAPVTYTEEHLPGQNIVEVQANQSQGETEGGQLQMQVQMLDTGETTISAEDLAKLSSYEGLVPSDISATQLITYALNAISENSEDQSVQNTEGLNGVQTSISSTSTKDGITTHTITFHLPNSEGENTPTAGDEGNIAVEMADIDQGDVKVDSETVYLTTNSEQIQAINSDSIITTTSNVITEGCQEIEIKNSGESNSVLLSFPSTDMPVNVISLDPRSSITPSATIQDLAQVSCLVKESLFMNGTPNSNNVEIIPVTETNSA